MTVVKTTTTVNVLNVVVEMLPHGRMKVLKKEKDKYNNKPFPHITK